MRVAVFGVTNWDDEDHAKEKAPTLIEWEQRVRAFIPQCTELFLTTGSYSPPEFNPLDIPIYQARLYKGIHYSVRNNYFHFGLKTGIWKKILDDNFDLLIHCQCTRFLGRSLEDEINEFMNRNEKLMAPLWTIPDETSIDVGFMCMKPTAAVYYAAAGHRYSLDQFEETINCEYEALLLFKKSWYNPWPSMPTTKQLRIVYSSDDPLGLVAPSTDISDKQYFCSLPIIANGKHVSDEFLQAWQEANPIPDKTVKSAYKSTPTA